MGSEKRFLGAPAVSSSAAIDAAWPTQIVTTLGPHELHRVVNGHARRDRSARRVDVQRNIFLGIFRFQKQQLGGDQVRDVVVNRRPDENDIVLEQAGINIVGPLSPVGLFDDHGN